MKKFLLSITFILSIFVVNTQAQSTCVFSGGPFRKGDNSIDKSIRFRVVTHANYVSGTFVMGSDLTYAPDPVIGVVSFTRIRGITITVTAAGHPSFQVPVTFVVPNVTTYDLALIGNLSVVQPAATRGLTVIGDSINTRASTFNITGTGVSITESPTGQVNLTITAGGGIQFNSGLTSGGVLLGDGITLARASSKLTLDSNGRLSLTNYVAAYDQESNVLSYGHLLDVGSQTVNSGSSSKQLDILRIKGTLTGSPTGSSHAYLYGINFNMEVTGDPSDSSEFDPVNLRGIIGEFRNNSPTGASVRGMNLHARAMTGSTGAVNAAAFAITAVSTTGTDLARAIQITNKGLTDRGIGIYFEQDSGINYKIGTDFSHAIYSVGAMKFASGQLIAVGRNFGNTVDLPILTWATSDRAQFSVPITSTGADAFVQVGSDADGYLFQKVDSDNRLRLFKQGGSGELFTLRSNGMISYASISFASLGSPPNGSIAYCPDCLKGSNPCSGSSTGAFAQRLNSIWRCD